MTWTDIPLQRFTAYHGTENIILERREGKLYITGDCNQNGKFYYFSDIKPEREYIFCCKAIVVPADDNQCPENFPCFAVYFFDSDDNLLDKKTYKINHTEMVEISIGATNIPENTTYARIELSSKNSKSEVWAHDFAWHVEPDDSPAEHLGIANVYQSLEEMLIKFD